MTKKRLTLPEAGELREALQAGGLSRRRSTRLLYEKYQDFIYAGIKRYRLSFEEAQDAYSDAIIGVCRQVEAGRFEGKSKLSTYLFQAFSNRCVDRTRKISSHVIEEDIEQYPEIPERALSVIKKLEITEDVNRLQEIMGQLGERCRQILMDAEYHGYTMAEIAEKMGFNNAATASNIKYRCMSRLRKILNKKS
jgi:RNA polymerase sigma factor (sigma-70 family)